MLPHVLRLWTLPHHLGGLRSYHTSHNTRPHLATKEGSGADTCPSAPDCALPQRWAPVLAHVPWLSVSHGP
jgi:hypothetical protein